jgi:hypothetical protein
MKKHGILLAVLVFGWMGAAARAEMEARAQLMLDPDHSKESSAGILAGVGTRPFDRIGLGIYGSVTPTDRDLPAASDWLYGLGLYGELDLSEGYDLMPYIGLRGGLLQPEGAHYDTAKELVGTAGLRYRLTDEWAICGSFNVHWASEKLYDFKDTKTGWDADRVDYTVDLGIRYLF